MHRFRSADPALRLARWLTLIYWPVLIVATHWPALELPVGDDPLATLATDKLLHFAVFAGLTLLLIHACPAPSRAFVPNLLAGVLIASIYAVVDEVSQIWFDRTIAGADVTANLAGVFWVTAALATANEPPRSNAWMWVCRVACLLWTVATVVVLANFDIAINAATDFDVALALASHGFLFTVLMLSARIAGRDRPGAGVAVTFVVQVAVALQVGRTTSEAGPLMGVVSHWQVIGILAAVTLHASSVLVRRWRERKTDNDRGWPRWLAPPIGPTRDEPNRDFVGHAVLVSALTLLSRITGLLRDCVMAAAFGVGPISAAFYLAFLVPNLFRRLFGEGALSSAFIPVYTRLAQSDARAGSQFATTIVALAATVLTGVVLAGESILAWLLTQENLDADTALAIRLCMIMLPYMPLICLVAVLGAVSQVHGRHGPPAALPIVLNVTWIAGAVGGIAAVRDEYHAGVSAIFIVAVSVLLAGVLQLLIQLFATLRVDRPALPSRATIGPLRDVLVTMGPMLLGLAVFQINVLLDGGIAFFLSPREGADPTIHLFGHVLNLPVEVGGIAALHWAQRLYQFPLGVFGIAIATAIYPAMVSAATARTHNPASNADPLADIVRRGLRLTVFIGLPASAGLALLHQPVVQLVYQRGAFSLEDATLVATILTGYASAIWAYTLTHVITRAFYAAGRAGEPVRISVMMVALNVGLNFVLVWPLRAAGLAWSTAVCAVIGVILLLWRLRGIVHKPVDGAVQASWIRSALATAIMGAALGPPLLLVDATAWGPAGGAVFTASLVLGGATVYLLAARVMRCEELTWLRRK